MEAEITASRKKTTLYLMISLGFAVSGALLSNKDDTMLWVSAFFGLCALVFIMLLVRPQRLFLDREGFSLSGGLLRSPTKIAWQDVTGFFVVSLGPGNSLIGFNYSPNALNKPRGTAFSRRVAGAEGAISGVWSGSNAAVVDKLNDYRQKALAGIAA